MFQISEKGSDTWVYIPISVKELGWWTWKEPIP